MLFLNTLSQKNFGQNRRTIASKKSGLERFSRINSKKISTQIKCKLVNNENVNKLIVILFSFFSLNTKSTAFNPHDVGKTSAASGFVDGNLLGVKREDIFNEKFLFSNRTTQNTEIESEIEEIEDDEFRYSAWKNSQVGLTVGGSALSMWFAYRGLNIWEKWMKEQEQKDIEEEIEMTGTYINPGARNVESSIDPITGKKIDIKSIKEADPNEEKPK